MDTIPFILDDPDHTGSVDRDSSDQDPPRRSGTKGLFGPDSDEPRRGITEVPVDRLRESLARLTTAVSEAFSHAQTVGDFQLDQITLQAEVSAQGGISLIGSAKVGGRGAITLTFKRP